jgi:hypothetical protein
MTLKRAHETMPDGTVKQLPFLVDEQGNVTPFAISNPRVMSKSFMKSKGGVIVNQNSNQNSMQTQSVISQMQNKVIAPPIHAVETPYGKLDLARAETNGVGSSRRLFTLTVTNTELTTESVVIGDGSGFIKELMAIGAPKAGVTFSGTYGATSYQVIQDLVKSTALRLQGLQFQGYDSLGVKSDNFFNSGSFRSAVVDPLKYTIDNPYVSFSDLVQQDSFNTNIREEKNYRFLLSFLTGMVITLPTATRVTINCTVSSAYMAYNMVRF